MSPTRPPCSCRCASHPSVHPPRSTPAWPRPIWALEQRRRMIENPDRIEQFRDEIADMKLPDTAGSRERTLAGVGVGIMAVGLIVGVVAYPISHSTNNPLQQRDAMIV